MKYLMEHEAGFDPEAIGFPSIMGCHAIVFQTAVGLWGYHNAGGSGSDKFAPRSRLFQTFIENHFLAAGKGVCLYGCTFVSNNKRGYSGTAKDSWKAELKQFAKTLGYKGAVRGYDLAKSLNGQDDSAYVEFRKTGASCNVYVKKWDDGGLAREEVKTLGERMNHKKIVSPGHQNRLKTTTVNSTGLVLIQTAKL